MGESYKVTKNIGPSHAAQMAQESAQRQNEHWTAENMGVETINVNESPYTYTAIGKTTNSNTVGGANLTDIGKNNSNTGTPTFVEREPSQQMANATPTAPSSINNASPYTYTAIGKTTNNNTVGGANLTAKDGYKNVNLQAGEYISPADQSVPRAYANGPSHAAEMARESAERSAQIGQASTPNVGTQTGPSHAAQMAQESAARSAQIGESIRPSTATTPIPETGKLDVGTIDYRRISRTAASAGAGDFINEERIQTQYWGDNGELSYNTRKDGTIEIRENGEIIGFTDEQGIRNALGNGNTASATSGIHDNPNNNLVGKVNLTDLGKNNSNTATPTSIGKESSQQMANAAQSSGNLIDRGYPSSTEGTPAPKDLADRGYPSSTEGLNTGESIGPNKGPQGTWHTANNVGPSPMDATQARTIPQGSQSAPMKDLSNQSGQLASVSNEGKAPDLATYNSNPDSVAYGQYNQKVAQREIIGNIMNELDAIPNADPSLTRETMDLKRDYDALTKEIREMEKLRT